MASVSIGISTFIKRFGMFKELVADIRRHTDAPIMVMVNGELDRPFDEDYRREMLAFCASIPGVYPHIFPEFQGLSKLWNTMVLNAPTSHVWILNDDVKFKPGANPIPAITAHIEAGNDLFYAPWGWSHFVIGREILDELGYFDERLIGVGEEDGDMLWRYEMRYRRSIGEVKVEGVGNAYDYKQATDGVDTAYGNKTKFNTLFVYGRKYRPFEGGHKGMFTFPVDQVLPNERQYPYERHKWANRPLIGDTTGFRASHEVDWSAFKGMKPWVSE